MHNYRSSVLQYSGMICDRTRNDFFRQALIETARDKVVMDVGSGTGILSFYALEAGARFVYAIELQKESAEVTDKILSSNFPRERFKVLNIDCWTERMNSQTVDKKIDVLVSETVGPGLFDQGWFHTLHSLKPLLSDDAVIIPDTVGVDAWVYPHTYLEPNLGNDQQDVSFVISNKESMLSGKFADAISKLLVDDYKPVENFYDISYIEQTPAIKNQDVVSYSITNMPDLEISERPYPSHIVPNIWFDMRVDEPGTVAMVNKMLFRSRTLYLKDAPYSPWKYSPIVKVTQSGDYRFTYSNPFLGHCVDNEWSCVKRPV